MPRSKDNKFGASNLHGSRGHQVGCAIISWQTAGLVEYNFGDSEVMIIVWMLLGILLGDIRKQSHATEPREID